MHQVVFRGHRHARPHHHVCGDVQETENKYIVRHPALGIGVADLDVDVKERVLRVQLSAADAEKQRDDFALLFRPFSLRLPHDADENGIDATLSRGVLTINISRLNVESKKISIVDAN